MARIDNTFSRCDICDHYIPDSGKATCDLHKNVVGRRYLLGGVASMALSRIPSTQDLILCRSDVGLLKSGIVIADIPD